MTAADLPGAVEVSARALEVDLTAPGARDRRRARLLHPLETDPLGAFVAELDGELVGVGEAIVREGLWVLSLLAVDPTRQSAGAGRELMRATLRYGGREGGGPGLIIASDDPRSLRLYWRSGFRLIPAFQASGTLDRQQIAESDPEIVELSSADGFDSVAAVTRSVRGAAWTTDLDFAMRRGATVFALPHRGLVVAAPGDGIWALAAGDEQSATRLLRCGLAHAAGSERVRVRWITGAQQWAIATVLELGMELRPYGAICVRGRPGTLAPFIPSPPFA